MKYKLNPLQRFALFLLLYAGFAINSNFNQEVLLHLVATLGFAVALFYIFRAISGKKKNIWNTMITALIIFLVLNFGQKTVDLLYPLIAVLIAIIYKFFFEYKGRPIINPVVFSLLLLVSITTLIPNLEAPFVSWWGTSFSEPLALALVFTWIIAGLNVWKKWYLLVSFMVVFAVYIYFKGGLDFAKYIFGTGTIYFFAAVMLIEPKTSPIKKNQQIICGVFTALVYAGLLYYKADYASLLAIASMNLLNFGMMTKKTKKV